MGAVVRALEINQGKISVAREHALRLKDVGVLGLEPSVSSLDQFSAQRVTRERYERNKGWLFSAVNVVATEAAMQPVTLGSMGEVEVEEGERGILSSQKRWTKKKIPTGSRLRSVGSDFQVIEHHDLIDVLEHPNSAQDKWQFVYSFTANLLLTGVSYIIAGEGEDGLELYSLPSSWVLPDHSDGPYSTFKVGNPRKPSKQEEYTRDQVGVAYLPNPADWLGHKAPASAQMSAIRIDESIQTSQEAFFERGIFPSVVISIGRDPHPEVPGGVRPRLAPEQRRQITSIIQRQMGGVMNYGEPAIIDGLIESIERLSATQNEMGWHQSESDARNRILSAFGVHPFILGEAVSVGGYAQTTKIEERFCKRVNTTLDMLSGVVTGLIARQRLYSEKLMVWWEPCVPLDPQIHSMNMRDARRNGDITRDEWRAELGYPPMGDDGEQQARNKLLDSVGGITGAVAVLQAAGQGFISSESAASLFSLFFELPIEEAQEIVGDAREIALAEETLSVMRQVLEQMKEPVTITMDSVTDDGV
jgi:hypothetical protein